MLKYAPSLVVKVTNASGEINGSPLEVVTFGSPNNPAQTVTGTRKLANDDKVFAILGPYVTVRPRWRCRSRISLTSRSGKF